MKCRKIQKLLPEYLEGDLSPHQLMIVENHIQVCDDCRKEFQALSKTIQMASSLQVEYPPPELWEAFIPMLHRRILQDTEKELQRGIFFKRFAPLRLAGMGAAALILIGFLVTTVYQTMNHRTKPEIIPFQAVLAKVLIDDEQATELEKLDTSIPIVETPMLYGYIIPEADLSTEENKSVQTGEELTDVVNNLIDIGSAEAINVSGLEDDELLDVIAYFTSNR